MCFILIVIWIKYFLFLFIINHQYQHYWGLQRILHQILSEGRFDDLNPVWRMYILLIDSQKMFADGLRNMLINNEEITEVFISDEVNFKTHPNLPLVDLVICDMSVPKMNSLSVIDHFRNKYKKNVGIIVLSGLSDLQTIKETIRLGANAFISKNSDISELFEGIREVNAGKKFIGRNLRVNLVNSLFVEEHLAYHLSRREREVLQGICSGLVVKDIGTQLGLSPHTVQYYQKNIMKKLKISRTVDLIVYAVQNGLYAFPSKN